MQIELLRSLLENHNVSASFTWTARVNPEIKQVDLLSKYSDPTDLSLTGETFHRICMTTIQSQHAQQVLRRDTWGYPTLDAFANETNAKASVFFSRWQCPGSSGVDGYTQPWPKESIEDSVDKKINDRQLVWCWLGPFADVGQLLKKIQQERCDTILILSATDSKKLLHGSIDNNNNNTVKLPVIDFVEVGVGGKNGVRKVYEKGLSFPNKGFAKKMQGREAVVAHLISWALDT